MSVKCWIGMLRRRLECKQRSSCFERDRVSYIEQCSVVNTMLYKAMESYYSSLIQDDAHNTISYYKGKPSSTIVLRIFTPPR